MTLNKVLFVPNNEPLLGILDKFQEGRSHMAFVSRLSVDKAKCVKMAVARPHAAHPPDSRNLG